MPQVCIGRLSLQQQRSLSTALWALLLCTQAALGFSLAGQQENTCEANGSIYYLGEWYFLDSDPCTQCECTAEGSVCARTECTSLPAACIHVSHYPTDCCPRCEKIGCEYRGVVYELGQNFQPSECEQCTCDSDGIARCLVADCAPPPCVNPVYQPGKCCPECKEGPNCYADASRSEVIPAGEPVWVDSCTKCRCHDGKEAGYWEGNRLATCSRLKNCTAQQPPTPVH
ncbi:von Willebrand factor C domain-containing protein 2-like [Girardinichthys multiradiatus]|uniref:von Willebrand factor C domain-containing protein 2-like n=1 Tax=Girardinichthys multiradiatus TaxID=208333 RepID=UPI001FADFA58|nr:von Willebrand factor C domain-containing protein 2-like [Girardinichthys multiradiatus]